MQDDNTSATSSADYGSYARSMGEIEQLLTEIEAEDVDIDQLLTKVTRAAELIKHCKGKLRATETEVRNVLDSLGDNP